MKSNFKDKRRGFASGIDGYMTKPVNYEELPKKKFEIVTVRGLGYKLELSV